MSKNVIASPAGVVVPASSTVAITKPFDVVDKRAPWARIVCATAPSDSLTFRLTHSLDNGATFSNMEGTSTVSSSYSTSTTGVREVSTLVVAATASTGQGDFVKYTAWDGTTYGIWFDIDDNGTQPVAALFTGTDTKIKVSIVTGASQATNAAALLAAVNASAMTADFTMTALGSTGVTFTQIKAGDVANPTRANADNSGAGSLVSTVTTAGSNGYESTTYDYVTLDTAIASVGDPVLAVAGAGSALPAPLVSGTIYYYKMLDNGNSYQMQFCATSEDAQAGNYIPLTAFGYGTPTYHKLAYDLKAYWDSYPTEAFFRAWSPLKIYATNAGSDAVTIGAVYVQE